MSKDTIFKNKKYNYWFLGDTSTALAIALRNFGVSMITLMLTNDTRQAGLVASLGIFTQALFSLVGGVYADRKNRFKILLYAALVGLIVSLIWFATFFIDLSNPTLFLIPINIALGIRYGFSESSSTASLVDIVPEDKLGKALAANQARDSTISLTGAPIGGVLMTLGAQFLCLALIILETLNLIAYKVLGKSSKNKTSAPSTEDAQSFIQDSLKGARWIFSNSDILRALISSTLFSLGVSGLLVTIIYSLQQEGESYALIGLVSASIGVGTFLGSFLTSLLISRYAGGKLIIFAGSLITFFILSLTSIHVVPLIMLALSLIFILVPVYNVVLMSYLLLKVPNNMLGKVNSSALLLNLGATSLPPLLVGVLLQSYGKNALILVSAMLAAGSLINIIFTHHIRKIPRQELWGKYIKELD